MGVFLGQVLVVEDGGLALEDLKDELLQTGLHTAIRAVQYGIPQSSHHFFAMLEHYNPEMCTFFTLVGRWGSPFMRCTKSLD